MIDETIKRLTALFQTREQQLSYLVKRVANRYNVTLQKEQIEDIISDAYELAVFKLRDDHPPLEFPIAWFSKIVVFKTLNRIRREMRRIDRNRLAELEETDLVYEAIENHREDESLRRAIEDHLDEIERLVLMKLIDGYDYEEIAQQTGKTKEALRQIRSRAVRKLRNWVS